MPGNAESLNAAGLLAIALTPEWVDQASYTGAPTSASAGVSLAVSELNATPKAMVRVSARTNVHRREARVTVTTRDATANYTVTVNGTAIATTTGAFANNDLILVELKAKIAADATVGGAAGASQVVTSILLDANGDETDGTVAGGTAAATLVVQGTVEADYSIAVSAGGTGVLACEADPVSFDLRVFGYEAGIVRDGSDASSGWDMILDGDYTSLDYRGFIERYDVAGLSRLYVEVDNIAGHASDGGTVTYAMSRVRIGPSVLEASS